MSAREDRDTVPPPDGEDDAYSAATKVGALPHDLMAALRGEGLLPPDDDQTVKGGPLPSPSFLASRRASAAGDRRVPALYSS
ncbi:MAG TPA: hypothetical protein VM580_13525, partial [Labilithrix sp.]|nr:hypothetical protein [Labilithrix sp.]